MRRQRVDPAATGGTRARVDRDRRSTGCRPARPVYLEGPGRDPSICALGAARHNRHARGSGTAIRRGDPVRSVSQSARRQRSLLDRPRPVDVAKDPHRDRHEPITSLARQAGECSSSPCCASSTQCPLQPIDPSGAASRRGRYTYGSRQTRLVRSRRGAKSSPTLQVARIAFGLLSPSVRRARGPGPRSSRRPHRSPRGPCRRSAAPGRMPPAR